MGSAAGLKCGIKWARTVRLQCWRSVAPSLRRRSHPTWPSTGGYGSWTGLALISLSMSSIYCWTVMWLIWSCHTFWHVYLGGGFFLACKDFWRIFDHVFFCFFFNWRLTPMYTLHTLCMKLDLVPVSSSDFHMTTASAWTLQDANGFIIPQPCHKNPSCRVMCDCQTRPIILVM